MTLEKILIFGFAIAATFSLTVLATGTTEDRKTMRDGYKGKVDTLVEIGQ